MAGTTAAKQPERPANLSGAITGQQRRVLALLAKGFTNSEIARYLGFSVSTANYHVGAILAKLGVSNRAEAAAIAVREQLIDEVGGDHVEITCDLSSKDSVEGTKKDPKYLSCLNDCVPRCLGPPGSQTKERIDCIAECQDECCFTYQQCTYTIR